MNKKSSPVETEECSLPLIFILHWWPLGFLIFSPPLQNFHVVFPTKMSLLCFLSLALDLCCPFSRWASLVCRLLSLFHCLSQALHCKFVDMTTQIQKQFPFSVFVLIDSLLVSAIQDAGAMRFPSKIASSCIWVAIAVNWVIYIGMPVVEMDGWSSGRAGVKGHLLITKTSGMGRWTNFLTIMLRCARFALLRAPLVIIHGITLRVIYYVRSFTVLFYSWYKF